MLNRRESLAALAALAASATGSNAAPVLDAESFGIRHGTDEDMSFALQRAIETAASNRAILAVGPGTFRINRLNLPPLARITGVKGSTRFLFTGSDVFVTAQNAEEVMLTGITFDGANRPVGDGRGLVHLSGGRNILVADCAFINSTAFGLLTEGIQGAIRSNNCLNIVKAGLFCRDSRGLIIRDNQVKACQNNGILVWRSAPGHDGTLITGNQIEDIGARDGGSGQNGNGINVFKAGNVVVSDNRIRNCAFTAIRANSSPNVMIRGNHCTQLGEVAIYAEFAFDGAIISQNIIDGAAVGISSTNFNNGGRLSVIDGNLIRNLIDKRPPGTDPGDAAGIGIAAEADAAITGNVVENAPFVGIALGWGPYLRDITVSGNVVRGSGIGIGVSAVKGAGQVLLANNLIAESKNGGIVALDHKKSIGEIKGDSDSRFPNITAIGNRLR